MLHIHKELAVKEDIVWGWGTVTQTRDLISGGVGPQDYHKVNASIVPAADELGAETSDVQTELDKRLTIINAAKTYALIGGSPTQTFHVAPATAGTHATPQAQVTAQIAAAVSGIANNYAKRDNVLGLDQTTPFTPTTNYQPATKLYVDNKLTAIGAGDMTKHVYDKNDNGIVDNSEALGGIPAKDAFMYRGTGTSLDANNFNEMGNWVGQNITDAPDTSSTMIANFRSTTGGLAIQMAYSQGTNRSAQREFNGTKWNPWQFAIGSGDIVNNYLGNAGNQYAVASADLVKGLKHTIDTIKPTPIGTIVMFSGNINTLPAEWHLCDGHANTPNMEGKFVKGTTDGNKIGTHGGTKSATMPSHTHTANHGHARVHTNTVGDHYHSASHTHSASATNKVGHQHDSETPFSHPWKWDGNKLQQDKLLKASTTHPSDHTVSHFIDGSNFEKTTTSGAHGHKITVHTTNVKTNTTGDHKHTVTIPTESVTTGSAHTAGDNEPPYYVLAFIMKIA